MARMIPPVIDPDTPSPGEIEIFRRLKEDPETATWTVLHSLEVAHHLEHVAGEIDFVVIIPEKGVLCIEVKAHSHIRSVDGRWLFGKSEESKVSPFKQAAVAMHSIRERVTGRSPALSRVPFWSCVVLPYVELQVESEEWHSWQLIDSRAFRARPISKLLLGVMDHARDFLTCQPSARWFRPEEREPTESHCRQLVQLLRPIFDVFESPRAQRDRAEGIMRQYTEDQFAALDAMEDNPRVIFTGPAGTGKTLLAIEAAKRARDEGRKALLICFNDLLGHWLTEQTVPLRPEVTTRTLHQQMFRVAAKPATPTSPGHEYWQEALPSLAVEKLLDTPRDEFLFDEVIVDEAQDVLRESYLDFLDLSLKGGLAGGQLRLFGDFEKQALYDSADVPLQDFRRTRCADAVVYALHSNCRNTPRVTALVRLLCSLEPDYKRILRPDDDVQPRIRYYTDATSQSALLIQALTALYEEKFKGSEIVILSPRGNTRSAAARVDTAPWRDRLAPYKTAAPGQIRYSTIQAFKGLEAPAIIMTDIDTVGDLAAESLFYVGMTRAIHRLIVLADEHIKRDLVQMLNEGLLATASGGR